MTTMTETTTQVYQLYIRATPEQVWDAITKSEFRRKYFFGTSIESTFEAGASMRSLSPDGTAVWGDNTVLESDPPRKLVHTWRSLYDAELSQEEDSRVTWQIDPAQGGLSKLTLIHDRLEGAPKTAAHVAGGWMWVLSGMKTLLETGEAFPAFE
jgi:uncharacterized protein YndB with AHSA1/START domain